MRNGRTLTTSEILAAATSELVQAEYERVSDEALRSWPFSNSRVFEDNFGVVAVLVFASWEELTEQWVEAQSAFAMLISQFMSRSEPKAWDGYLVLLTPGIRGSTGVQEWMQIRYNTSRFRKLVASGEDLRTLADIRSILLPLLPLNPGELEPPETVSVLDLLPKLLGEHIDLEQRYIKTVVDAFETEGNMLQALHDHRADGT